MARQAGLDVLLRAVSGSAREEGRCMHLPKGCLKRAQRGLLVAAGDVEHQQVAAEPIP